MRMTGTCHKLTPGSRLAISDIRARIYATSYFLSLVASLSEFEIIDLVFGTNISAKHFFKNSIFWLNLVLGLMYFAF